jgi:hypothetical protein
MFGAVACYHLSPGKVASLLFLQFCDNLLLVEAAAFIP